MLKTSCKPLLKNEKGMAVFELIPTLFIYMLLINFSLGFFGIVHSGILQSIAARNYTFETLRHRADVVYHRNKDQKPFDRSGQRYSGIILEHQPGENVGWPATARPIAFASSFGGTDKDGVNLAARGTAAVKGEQDIHNNQVRTLNESVRNESIGVKSVWIKTVYGICIDSKCGD